MICEEKKYSILSVSKIKTLPPTERSSNMDTGEFWTHEVVTPAAKFIGTK